MNEELWFKCPHCRAMFRGDNNLCISCGAPAELWEGNPPRLSMVPYGLSSCAAVDWRYISTTTNYTYSNGSHRQ